MSTSPSQYGFREGRRQFVWLPVDSSTSDISVNDFVIFGTAGYVQKCSAGDIPIGVAASNVTAPASDGAGPKLKVDVSEDSIYEFPPDAGTVTAALAGCTCDIGGAQSINIDASADDCILIRRVDTDANTVFCSIKLIPAGVV
jgi:hypothetical protein